MAAEEEDGRIDRRVAAALDAVTPAIAALCRRLVQEENGYRQDRLAADETGFGTEPPADPMGGRARPSSSAAVLAPSGPDGGVRTRREKGDGALGVGFPCDNRQRGGDLAAVEEAHRERAAAAALDAKTAGQERTEERRAFRLAYVQPGLAGRHRRVDFDAGPVVAAPS